jgi:hypothetical protein
MVKHFHGIHQLQVHYNIRATVISGSRQLLMTIVSDRDRHLIALGTETTIGTTLQQDPMFIRFSNQEDL